MGLFSNNNGKKLNEETKKNNQLVTEIGEDKKMNTVCFISKETKIVGEINTKSMFQLEGVLEGNIHGELLIHIGTTGKVKGNIYGKSVLIEGEVTGEIFADRVEIGSKGRVVADIASNIFVVQEGGIFEGNKKTKSPAKKVEIQKDVIENKNESKKNKESNKKIEK